MNQLASGREPPPDTAGSQGSLSHVPGQRRHRQHRLTRRDPRTFEPWATAHAGGDLYGARYAIIIDPGGNEISLRYPVAS